MKLKRPRASLALPVIAITALGCGYFQSQKDRALEAAIRSGSLEAVQHALIQGANPNATLDEGAARPLLLAIVGNGSVSQTRKAIIEALLHAGANPSEQQRDGMDALYLAANGGDADLCARFCRVGVSPTRPAFRGVSAWQAAAINGSAASLLAMLPYIPKSQIDTVSTYKEHGNSALGFACGMGHQEAAELLLDHGANPDCLSASGFTPLQDVAMGGDQVLAESLLEHGAKVDFPFRNGATALAFASLDGHLEVMRVLIAHGADINHRNKHGVTPVMDAAMEGHQDAVDLLLKAGARSDIRSDKGLTATDYEKQRESGPPGSSLESLDR